ncbi:MAG: polyprenyl synthetase family protein [Phycisphaerales bacterium]
MSEPVALIERFMASYLDSLRLPPNLDSATRYALFGPGKRARPVLAVHACRALGAPAEDALPAASSVEMVHAFSLVHDDLPALDNDDLRRGRPTTHVAHGEAMALLVGDLLNTLAFQVVAERVADAGTAAALTREITRGTTAMIVGQVYDTLGGFTPGLNDAKRLELVHRNKTGALIRASCRMGALSAGPRCTPEALQSLTTYGEAIGLMFQIVDDLLDVEQSAEHTGKATGKDAALGKLTYPGVMGVESSRREITRLRGVALEALRAFGGNAGPLVELCEYLAVRTR